MEQLISMVQGTTAPVLTVDELQRCLDDSRQAFIWSASEDFSVVPRELGSVIIPTAANRTGHRYKLMAFDGTGTTSGTTEPSWIRWRTNPLSRGELVSDGNLIWREDGADYDSLWDMQMAAYLGWQLKATKASQCVDFTEDTLSFKESQSFDHCLMMARRYAPVMC